MNPLLKHDDKLPISSQYFSIAILMSRIHIVHICSKNLWTLKEFLPFVGIGGANGHYDHNMPHFPVCLSKAFLSLLQFFFFVKCNHGWLQMAHSCKIKWTFLNEKKKKEFFCMKAEEISSSHFLFRHYKASCTIQHPCNKMKQTFLPSIVF